MTSVRFPYARNDLPILPITLIHEDQSITTEALIDSGSQVNILPYDLGIAVGLNWDAQTFDLTPVGYLQGAPVYAVTLLGQVADFLPVELCFAWSGKSSNEIRLILGQRNFFRQFNILFEGAVNAFELWPRGAS